MTALGNFIRNRRKALGLTQTQLALRIGVDDAYVSAIERGLRTPDGATFLEGVGAALDLDLDGLRQLTEVAKRSKRYVRLPDELPLRKHQVITALVGDRLLTDADMETIASVYAAIVRNRTVAMSAVQTTDGGLM
uniref:Helix-turn-helix domain protein n=1 Tax=Burkholderia sp. (strain CCGE1003) TaxID=640512 RepID=E1T3X6_BURSG